MFRVRLVGLALLAAAMPRGVPAQSSGGPYVLTRTTVDNGGGYSAGGIFELNYTIGQPDAATPLTGGVFRLQPGFWGGYAALPTNFGIFRDGFEG